LKAIVFELPRPEDLEEGRLDRILSDLHEALAELPRDRVRRVLSYRGRPGLLLQLANEELAPACARVRSLLQNERIEYVEHLYYGVPRSMFIPAGGISAEPETKLSPVRRRRMVRRCLQAGHAFCRLDLFSDAQSQFQKAHTLDPNCAEAVYGLGLVEAWEGHDETAERLLRRAIALDPQKAAYFLALGRLLYRCSHLEAAEEAARRAIALDPTDPSCFDALGWICLDLGRTEKALAAFREALDLSPSLSSALSGMGAALFAEGRLKESTAFLEQALLEDPDYLMARLQLGWCRFHTGDSEQAEEDFLQVLYGPVHDLREPAAFGLGRLYLQRGSLDLAIENLQRCAGSWGQARWFLGEALFQAGRLPEAEVEMLRALELDPGLQEEVETRLVLCCLHQGRLDEAQALVCKALENQGVQAPLLELLAAIHGSRGEWSQARQVLEEACRLEPDSAPACFQLGWVEENLDEPGRASESYQRALRLDPEFSEAALNLGWLFFDEGRLGEAAVLFESALQQKPQDGELLYALGRVLWSEGRFERAIARFEMALAQQPERADTRAWLGAALCSAGRAEEGRKELRQALREGPDEETALFIQHQLRQRSPRPTHSEAVGVRLRKKAQRLPSAS
jgi:tetratricopeptide (TPR) repeat protein